MPSETFMGSIGNNYAYNGITFAENEERSPWEPLHVQKGFKPTDSTVTVFHGCRSTTFGLGLRKDHWREHVKDMLLGTDAITAPVLLLDPITARQFIDRGGFEKKADLIRWIHETAEMPAGPLLGSATGAELHLPACPFGDSPFAEAIVGPDDTPVRMFEERTSMSWWSAAKPTATGRSWARTTRRPCRWTSGADECPASEVRDTSQHPLTRTRTKGH